MVLAQKAKQPTAEESAGKAETLEWKEESILDREEDVG